MNKFMKTFGLISSCIIGTANANLSNQSLNNSPADQKTTLVSTNEIIDHFENLSDMDKIVIIRRGFLSQKNSEEVFLISRSMTQ